MHLETILGCQTHITPLARLPVSLLRRRCRTRWRLHHRSVPRTQSLRLLRRQPAVKAAALDIGLAKDIYSQDPWWSRDPAPNMVSINSPGDLLTTLGNAGHRLVVIDFYARWCRSCRALYPKLGQICRSNPDVLLLKIDWDDNLELCQVMGVKALPFFHFYQSPFGCVDSFTISVSRVRKLKDTIAAYNVPFNTEASQLTGIESAEIELETEIKTEAAQLHKLEQIFTTV